MMRRQRAGKKSIMGIDEAGRGPLAGPVAVGACLYDVSDAALAKALSRLLPLIKDSKQLSALRREAIFMELSRLSRVTTLRVKVALVSAAVIDAHGISFAIRKGIARVTGSLSPDPAAVKIMLDGGLHAPAGFPDQQTHIKGDATYLPIALASIAAKVTRDRHMIRLAQRLPAYGFEIHKGYGTRRHYEALMKHGATAIHRHTFLKGRLSEAGS